MLLHKLKIVRSMGVRWTLYRAGYEAKKKFGLLEREFPALSVTDDRFLTGCLTPAFPDKSAFVRWWRTNRKPFFFAPGDFAEMAETLAGVRGEREAELRREADGICDGTFTYFSRWKVKHAPLNWHLNPATGKEAPRDVHWSKIPDLGGDFGDIKYIWELSRFPFAFTLSRAYASSGDGRYAETFWRLFESWTEANAPERGVHYKCGQEMSLRVMAWIWALYAFADHPSTTDDRIFSMLKQIYHHADHIDRHFDFALKSVRNNHTISEAAGLFTVGLLFPCFDKAGKWAEKGRKHLETEGMWQMYPDGSYVQHSVNYERLIVQDYTWAIRLGALNGVSFRPELNERLMRCLLFLHNVQDDATGRLPNYGMNDGALIHPLSCSDYLDYRPQLNALHALLAGSRLYEPGPHDENALWIAGPDALRLPVKPRPRATARYDSGGYYVIRGERGHAMIRCATYRHRPAQADMLHLDLWHGGRNVLCDAGTFSYNADGTWMAYFNGTVSHNTVTVDGRDQMRKGARFIWFDWTKSKTLAFEERDGVSIFEGEHYGYAPLVHRRAVVRCGDGWVVVDDIFGAFRAEGHRIAQSWLFGVETEHAAYVPGRGLRQIGLNVAGERWTAKILDDVRSESVLYEGDEQAKRGWRSLYYGEKIPAGQWVRETECFAPVRFVTAIAPERWPAEYDAGRHTLRFGNGIAMRLHPVGGARIFARFGEGERP
jgi:hypothetical protein